MFFKYVFNGSKMSKSIISLGILLAIFEAITTSHLFFLIANSLYFLLGLICAFVGIFLVFIKYLMIFCLASPEKQVAFVLLFSFFIVCFFLPIWVGILYYLGDIFIATSYLSWSLSAFIVLLPSSLFFIKARIFLYDYPIDALS
jgi:hypothetical protein